MDNTNKWKNILYSWVGSLNVVKGPYTQDNMQIQYSLYQIPHDIFCRNRKKKSTLKFIWDLRGP